jgi:hypothetical protein
MPPEMRRKPSDANSYDPDDPQLSRMFTYNRSLMPGNPAAASFLL